MYTAIVLDKDSQRALKELLGYPYTDSSTGWEMICHHVTICMGRMKGKYPFELGEEIQLEVIGAGKAHGFDIPIDKRKEIPLAAEVAFAAAVRLPEGKHVKNVVPHITLAVNRSIGGKPFHSNSANWVYYDSTNTGVTLKGIVQECS